MAYEVPEHLQVCQQLYTLLLKDANTMPIAMPVAMPVAMPIAIPVAMPVARIVLIFS